MTVTCRQIEEWLLEFVSGELPAEVCHHVRVHLEGCPPCVTLVETYQITIKVGQKLPPRPMPASLEARLKQVLEEIRRS